jgi:type VI secretion system protein ImpA
MLDDICIYYSKHEPSSPVPLLLRRAHRLVGADFLDLLKDLAPSGLSEIQVISGSESEESQTLYDVPILLTSDFSYTYFVAT